MSPPVLCSKGLSCMWQNAYRHLCPYSLGASSPSHSQWKQSPEQPESLGVGCGSWWDSGVGEPRSSSGRTELPLQSSTASSSVSLSHRSFPLPLWVMVLTIYNLSAPFKKKTKERDRRTEAHAFEACCLWKLHGTLRVGTHLFHWDKADSSVVWQTTNFHLFYTLLPTQRCEAHNDVPQTLLQILTSTLVLATSLLPLTSSTCPSLWPSGPNTIKAS